MYLEVAYARAPEVTEIAYYLDAAHFASVTKPAVGR